MIGTVTVFEETKQNFILQSFFGFALQLIQLYQVLKDPKEHVISKQLLSSGKSIGANVGEAIAAQSRKDFVSKMNIASKEARDAKYRLRLLTKSQIVKYDYSSYLDKIGLVVNVLTAIVKSTRETDKRNS